MIVKSTKVPRPPAVKVKREMLKYSGNSEMPLTSSLKITMPNEDAPSGVWPCFRMMVCFRTTSRDANTMDAPHPPPFDIAG